MKPTHTLLYRHATAYCLLAIGLVAGCSPRATLTPDDAPRASVVTVTADLQEHYITDYLPTLTDIPLVEAGPGVQIDRMTDTTFTLSLSRPLSTITFTQGHTPYTLVVEDLRAALASEPEVLYSTAYDAASRTLSLGFTQRPTTVVALWQNTALPPSAVSVTDQTVDIVLPRGRGIGQRRTYLRIFAATADAPMTDVLIPMAGDEPVTAAGQLDRHDPESQMIYSVLIDRFSNGQPANDWHYRTTPEREREVRPEVDYYGGDLQGITGQIEAGYFDSLAINTLWISPITQNPLDAWGQYHDPDTRFTGYHGYWPIFITRLDPRLGTEQELRTMLATAHRHGINVILDYVANHLHQDAPLFQAHRDWATDSITPDGRRNFELWDEFRLTTWFDQHLPTLDLERADVAGPLTDSALYWVRNYDFDGYRHDACKHIPLSYWRTFTHKLKTDPDLRGRSFWMIGETYGSAELIGSYVKTGMLDAQFDFNLYHCAIEALAGHGGHTMQELAQVIRQSAACYGSHHTMGNITGNHDKARYVSLAGGDLNWDEDPKAAGWRRHVGVGDSVRGYAKQLLLSRLNLVLPGVPCVYQGDEYGQEGGGDPDNRRMMRFEGLNRYEQRTLQAYKRAARLRRDEIALQVGDYVPLYADDTTIVFVRSYLGHGFLIGLNCGSQPYDGQFTLPAGLAASGPLSLHVDPDDMTLVRF